MMLEEYLTNLVVMHRTRHSPACREQNQSMMQRAYFTTHKGTIVED